MATCTSCSADVQLEDTFCPRCGSALVDPLIGTIVGDRYRIVSRIGVGGMGAVYRCEHVTLRRDLAIKVLLPELGGREEFARRFEREAESASRLAHPNIVHVIDFGRAADSSLYLVMEFLGGVPLSSAIAQGPMPPVRALAIIRQILKALDHAHVAGVVHRDLKPDNIMLVERESDRDFVKILDFGIAKVTQPSSGGETLTQAGVIFGTPEYLSPEQALGEAVDGRADVYAAGVILYEMLVGRRPFESDDKVKIISMHLAHPPPPMRELNPALDISPALEQVVMQALEKHRENRFASAPAFLQALEDAESDDGGAGFATGETLAQVAVPPAASLRAGALRRAGRGLAAHRSLVIGLLLAAGLVAGGTYLGRGGLPSMGAGALSHAPPPPAPPPPALASRLKKVIEALEGGNTGAARLALEEELAERPKDARVRYMLGRVAWAEGKRGEALDNYRDAITLDAGFRGDAIILAHINTALSEPRHADEGLDLLIDKIGAPGTDLLANVANESGDVTRRMRAAAALEDLGKGDRVDRVSLMIAQLKKASTCEERKVLVEKLRDAGDVRALPALRALRPRGFRFFRIGGANNSCMKQELAEAIKELEDKQ